LQQLPPCSAGSGPAGGPSDRDGGGVRRPTDGGEKAGGVCPEVGDDVCRDGTRGVWPRRSAPREAAWPAALHARGGAGGPGRVGHPRTSKGSRRQLSVVLDGPGAHRCHGVCHPRRRLPASWPWRPGGLAGRPFLLAIGQG